MSLPITVHADTPVMGILGGGQLAQMLSLAAIPLGCRVALLDGKSGRLNDLDSLLRFASGVDLVTLENEFVNADHLEVLERAGHKVFPSSSCLRAIQDKFLQKQTLQRAGIAVPRFEEVLDQEGVVQAAARLGWPLLLKKRRNAYDGKGNAFLHSPSQIAPAWNRLDGDTNMLYVEEQCVFQKELAIIVTRGHSGETVTYPVVETIQADHICRTVLAPARVPAAAREKVAATAVAAMTAIGGVGSFGFEFFYVDEKNILINEIAPRVHNSGHYTIEACVCSQFENHVRAVRGWPLGSPAMRAPASAMVNLIAERDGPGAPTGVENALRIAGAHLHLYGKDRSMKGRKMGHVTALGATLEEARSTAETAAGFIRFGHAQ